MSQKLPAPVKFRLPKEEGLHRKKIVRTVPSSSRHQPATEQSAIQPKKENFRWLAYTYLMISMVCWGAALPLVKPALHITTPYRYLMYRFSVAIIFSLPILLYYIPKMGKYQKYLGKILLIELLGTSVGLGLLYIGLQHTSAMEASFIATTSPIFVTIAGIIFLKEKQQGHEWLGSIIAFLATLFFLAVPIFQGQPLLFSGSLLGNTFVLLQNICAALYFILAKKYYVTVPKFLVTTLSFYIGAASFLIMSLGEVRFSLPTLVAATHLDFQSGWVWGAVIYMAIFGSIIGLTAYMKGQEKIEASEASLFSYLQPLVFMPLSLILLREHIDYLQIGALFFILIGVFIAEKRSWRKSK
jgi:drug/metabolite transporter (DMT)-like permease